MRWRPRSTSARFIAAAAAALIGGCAGEGPFPSLAPRAVEFQIEEPAPAPAPVVPSDPATAAQIQALEEQARAGDTAFENEIGTARRLAGQAGGPGSDSWVAAQQALSRAQSARAGTMTALAELDSFSVRLAAARPPASRADIAAALAAVAAVEEIAARQQGAIEAVRSRLSPG